MTSRHDPKYLEEISKKYNLPRYSAYDYINRAAKKGITVDEYASQIRSPRIGSGSMIDAAGEALEIDGKTIPHQWKRQTTNWQKIDGKWIKILKGRPPR